MPLQLYAGVAFFNTNIYAFLLFMQLNALFMAKKCKKEPYEPPKAPHFICRKCERMAKKEQKLCKPEKL